MSFQEQAEYLLRKQKEKEELEWAKTQVKVLARFIYLNWEQMKTVIGSDFWYSLNDDWDLNVTIEGHQKEFLIFTLYRTMWDEENGSLMTDCSEWWRVGEPIPLSPRKTNVKRKENKMTHVVLENTVEVFRGYKEVELTEKFISEFLCIAEKFPSIAGWVVVEIPKGEWELVEGDGDYLYSLSAKLRLDGDRQGFTIESGDYEGYVSIV